MKAKDATPLQIREGTLWRVQQNGHGWLCVLARVDRFQFNLITLIALPGGKATGNRLNDGIELTEKNCGTEKIRGKLSNWLAGNHAATLDYDEQALLMGLFVRKNGGDDGFIPEYAECLGDVGFVVSRHCLDND